MQKAEAAIEKVKEVEEAIAKERGKDAQPKPKPRPKKAREPKK